MSGILVLALRIVVAVCLYAFFGWALWILWRELRLHAQLTAERHIPALILRLENADPQDYRRFTSPLAMIGRDSMCDFILRDETISAQHARLSYHHNQWWLEDIGSMNGTFINEEPVSVPTVVMDGDLVRCGQVMLEIGIESKPV
ncbi:MAG TPA: FHA domain-containing protein [Longilinea sp.]|nr:FHA domain-containing protein [Longilinea sp.]